MSARILVVDDDLPIREFCRRALSGVGVEVVTASTGAEASALLERGFDLILTDLMMPGRTDGLDLMREASGMGGARVVLMTGRPGMKSAIAAIRGRACDYLVKPFSIVQLREAVRKALDAPAPDVDLGPLVAPGTQRFVREHHSDYLNTGERREVTVLFADVRSFTTYAASVPPEEATSSLNEVLGVVVDAVHAHGGTVNKFIGDGLMALFGAPVPNCEHAAAAARAALAAVEAADRLAAQRQRCGLEGLRVGIGINTGEVVAGCIGTKERAEFTVIGHAVNLAARLEEAAGPGQIWVGPKSVALLGARFALLPMGLHNFQGLAKDLEVHRLTK